MNGLALRDLALGALSPHDPALASEVLGRAEIALVPTAQAWTSSEGFVQGRAVVVAVDAYTLGALRAAPSVADAVQRAMAHVLGAHTGAHGHMGEALAALTWTWSRAPRSPVEHYRGAGAHGDLADVRAGLLDWLEGAGEAAAVELVRTASVMEEGGVVVVTCHTTPSPLMRGAVAEAVRALFGPEARARWQRER